MSGDQARARSARLAAWTVRVAATYLLLGALAKAGWGAPDDLPRVLRENVHGSLTVLFQLVVGLELLTALTAMITPRLGWPVLATLLLGFSGILVEQVVAGESTCGCFG